MKTTYRKSCLSNLFQMSKFDLCSLLQGQVGSSYQKALYLPYYNPRALKCENNLQEVMACRSFASVEFNI